MSQTSTQPRTRIRFGFWLALIFVLSTSLFVLFQRQLVVDNYRFWMFQPSSSIAEITKNTTMTNHGRFYFYASHPELADRNTFNSECERKEPDSPILGCYVYQRIYVFNITNKKLDGMEEVTAAHEMLHAAYDRLSDSEKSRLAPMLQSDYQRLKTKELSDRMAYYDKYEPNEENNELYSILATEFKSLSPDLEAHFSQYFSDRLAVVAYHNASSGVFEMLNKRAETIAKELNALIDQVNSETKLYNAQAATLSNKVDKFNKKAKTPNGFSSEASFQAERAELLNEVNSLASQRANIQAKIQRYEQLRTELKSIAAESSTLNRSIDSTLSPATTL